MRTPREITPRRRAVVAVIWALLLATAVPSCTSYLRDSPYIKTSLAQQNYDAALARIEKIDKSSSRLLYLYEKGLVLHYDGRLEESNAALEEAELLYEDLYTKSLSREIGSLLTSDNIIKYRGERFEAAMIHYYKIINYLDLGLPEDALVECRKLNHRLKTFADDESNQVYPNDPFLQYLTGMVYWTMGEYNDADVSLRAALQCYEDPEVSHGMAMPADFYCDLVRSAKKLNDRQALERYLESGQCDDAESLPPGAGVLNLFIESGYIANKIEETVALPIYKDEYSKDLNPDKYADVLYHRYGHPHDRKRKLHYVLRVSVPVMVQTPFPFGDAEVRVVVDGHTRRSYAQMVENLDELAVRAFEARKGQIILKTIVRGLAKYLAKEGADDKQGEVAGWIINAINVATENADVRSWATLPGSIRMSRLVLPEGVHDIEIVLFDAFGGTDQTIVIPGVEVRAGQYHFMNYRIY